MVANKHDVRQVLNKLNWDVNTGGTKQIFELQVDVYKFIFDEPLEDENMKEFTEFIQDLNMRQVRSVMMMWIWLYQHGIKFRIKFGYNPRLSPKYNLKHIKEPKRIDKELRSNGHDDIMACRLDLLKEQYKTGGKEV